MSEPVPRRADVRCGAPGSPLVPARQRRAHPRRARGGAACARRSSSRVDGRRPIPETARRIADEGHLVGHHSHYHARMPLLLGGGLPVRHRRRRARDHRPRPGATPRRGSGARSARVTTIRGCSRHLATAGYRNVHWHVELEDWEPWRTGEAIAADARRGRDGPRRRRRGAAAHVARRAPATRSRPMIEGLAEAGATFVRDRRARGAAVRRPALLAVDGGGSKIDAALLRRDGTGARRRPRRRGRLRADRRRRLPRPDRRGDPRRVRRRRALDRCRTPSPTSASSASPARTFRSTIGASAAGSHGSGWVGEHVLRNDTFAVLRAGTDRTWGVGIVCGFGTNCCGVAPDGRVFRLPAIGPVSGDWGGAGDLGRAALCGTPSGPATGAGAAPGCNAASPRTSACEPPDR